MGLAVDPDMEKDERTSGVESDSDSDNVRSFQVHNIIGRLLANFSKKKRVTEEDEDNIADSTPVAPAARTRRIFGRRVATERRR